MKYFLMFISLAFLFYSCDGKKELIVEPTNKLLCGTSTPVSAVTMFEYLNEKPQHKLLSIESSNVNYTGTATTWKYNFRSRTGDSIFTFKCEYSNNSISVVIDTTENDKVGTSIITKNWIDSDIASAIAEKNGGSNFRSNYSNYKISVTLSEAVVPNSFPVWYISYIADKNLLIKINANNGKIIQ